MQFTVRVEMDMRFSESSAPHKKVARLQFGVWSPKAIRSASAVLVANHQTYEKGKPKKDGLSDPRMGTIDRTFSCSTCGCDVQNCTGHFGHIELAREVYHIGYLATLVKVLRCVSFYCSKLICDQNDYRFKNAQRIRSPEMKFKAMAALCDKEKMVCPYTDRIQPKFKVENAGISVDFGKVQDSSSYGYTEGKHVLTAAKAHKILQRVSDADYQLLGFPTNNVRPDWMILSVLPIPPPTIRPSIMDSSSRSDDDLTGKLADIIKANNKLAQHIKEGNTETVIDALHQLLQFHVLTYIDNSKPGQPVATQRSGRPIKAITQRLKGKDVSLEPSFLFCFSCS